MIETKVIKEKYSDEPRIYKHDTEILTQQAKLVLDFIEKWGMVAAIDAGEDSAGRQKIGLMPEDEVVTRAINMAEIAWARLDDMGLIHKLPGIVEMEAEVAEIDDE